MYIIVKEVNTMIIGKVNEIDIHIINKYADVGDLSISEICKDIEETYYELKNENRFTKFRDMSVFREKRTYRNIEYTIDTCRRFNINMESIIEYDVKDEIIIESNIDDLTNFPTKLFNNLHDFPTKFFDDYGITEVRFKNELDRLIDIEIPRMIVKDSKEIGKLQNDIENNKKLMVKYI